MLRSAQHDSIHVLTCPPPGAVWLGSRVRGVSTNAQIRVYGLIVSVPFTHLKL